MERKMKEYEERKKWENSGKWQWIFREKKNREKKMGKKKFGWGSQPIVWRKWMEEKRKLREWGDGGSQPLSCEGVGL